ncbi:MAG: inner nuclear membrane protein enriched at telomere/subtelomere region, partial [Chaenotheca gracillima]
MNARILEGLKDRPHSDPRMLEDIGSQLSKEVEQQEQRAETIKADIGKARILKRGQDTATGTKLTVMLGGHWWSEWTDSDYPSETEAIQMARTILERHLQITEEPETAKARLQKDASPQYEVGWRDHMAKVHKEVLTD